MMPQGTVVVRMGGLLRLDRLLEAGQHRGKALLLVEPMGKEMHADTRQMGRALGQRRASTNQTAQGRLPRAAPLRRFRFHFARNRLR